MRRLVLALLPLALGCMDPALGAPERRFHHFHAGTQSFPLDDHNSTILCSYNWIGQSAGPLNPIEPAIGDASCEIPEFASPNWSGGNSTSGLNGNIGVGAGASATRLNQLENNSTSGGWGGSSYAGPAVTGSILVRAVVKTPGTCATQTIYGITNTAGGDTLRMGTTAVGGCTMFCTWDDGPGATSTGSVVVNVSTFYFVDCFVGTDFKATVCVNGTCNTSATASGSTGLTPTTAGLLDNNANSQIWTGSALEVQLHNSATWWDSTVHTNECAAFMGATCAL